MPSEVVECHCAGPIVLTGDDVTCPRCGGVSVVAKKHRDYQWRLTKLGDHQPPPALDGEDGGNIDDMLAAVEYLWRKRRELWAAGALDELEQLDRELLTWAEETPKHIVLRDLNHSRDESRAPRQKIPRIGALRKLIRDTKQCPVTDDQLVEELKERCKVGSTKDADAAVIGIVGVMNELLDRGLVTSETNKLIEETGGIDAYVKRVLTEQTTAIDRALALSGRSKKTIEDASARVVKAGSSLQQSRELEKILGVRSRRELR